MGRTERSRGRKPRGTVENGKPSKLIRAAASARATELKLPWQEYAAKHQLKFSKTREDIVDAFLETHEHVDLHELLAHARARNPRIGLATVYRTVKLLEDAGIAESRHFADRSTVYEVVVGREHHDHLICESCGMILEFSDPEIERIQEEVAHERGFRLRRHRHELFGLCADCTSAATEDPV